MMAANNPANTTPANNGLAKTDKKTEAASSGRAKGGTAPSITAARITMPMEIQSSAAMT